MNRRPDLPAGAAVVVLGPAGFEVAERLAAALPEARVHGLARRVPEAELRFESAREHLMALFAARVPIVGVCAAGVLIRAVAPLVERKEEEGPVVAVAEDGSATVPLLGGHRGANALARAAAEVLGCAAAITTAGDLKLGFALDDPPPGWTVKNPEAAKAVTAALLAAEPVTLAVEAGDARWLTQGGARFADGAPVAVRLTHRAFEGGAGELVLHPAVLALGVGCERGADPEEVVELAHRALSRHELAPEAVACVASLDIKAGEPAVEAVAAHLGVPFRVFDAQTLEAETPRLAHPSEAVFRATGCHGVAEGAALAAAGPDGKLIAPKVRSTRATCAVAQAPEVIDAGAVGRGKGSLSVVGLGPGAAAWRSPEASSALAAAEDLVGYGPYVDLIGPLAAGKRCHRFSLGEEEARVEKALDLAAEGRTVALVSSGDAGIYAMAAPVFELLEREDRPAWRRVAVTVVPGMSALQAAAARAGAPLGNDFCAVSLSDLLTPWEVIERRLTAAAQGDFVVVLYNPASRRRHIPFARAKAILLRHRPARTPVVVARNLGRAGERVTTLTLDDLGPDDADMLSLVIVGNSQTRGFRRGGAAWVYTPRGDTRRRGKRA